MDRAEWSVLIADDEPAARRGVRQLLAAFPRFAVVGECRNGSEVVARLERARPDVLFLDVQMPGLDGFEVIHRRTPERMPPVVFLTAYDEFAVRAFEAQALDYLVKPVTTARFAATMTRLTKQLSSPATASDDRIVIPHSRGATILALHEVDWIESAGNYARLWLGSTSHLLRESLHSLEARIRPHGFVRAHRTALIRLAAVREFVLTPSGNSLAILESGTRIPISRRRRAEFSSALRSATL